MENDFFNVINHLTSLATESLYRKGLIFNEWLANVAGLILSHNDRSKHINLKIHLKYRVTLL